MTDSVLLSRNPVNRQKIPFLPAAHLTAFIDLSCPLAAVPDDSPEKFVVYLMTNLLDGRQYVGQTQQGLRNRAIRHMNAKSSMHIAKAIRKYGTDQFVILHLASTRDSAELRIVENILIAQYNTRWPNGYNEPRENTRSRLSRAQAKARKQPETIARHAIRSNILAQKRDADIAKIRQALRQTPGMSVRETAMATKLSVSRIEYLRPAL